MKLILECFWFPATRPSSLLPPQHVFIFVAMKEAKCNVLPCPFPTEHHSTQTARKNPQHRDDADVGPLLVALRLLCASPLPTVQLQEHSSTAP